MTLVSETIDKQTKTILVVEDSDELRIDVIEMLRLEGYTTAGAEDGLVGVEQAQKVMPDLIVCDIMMPNLDGYEVLQELRANTQTAGIPFIFLTAKSEHIDQRHGMVLGADDFITKPFQAHELLDSIETQLKKREEQLAIVQNRIEEMTKSIARALPHEFRTPLNTILGFSEILQAEAQNLKPDQVASWGQHIHVAAFRLHNVVENYLLYVRLQVLIENEVGVNEEAMDAAHLTLHSQAMSIASKYNRDSDLTLDLQDAPPLAIKDEHGVKAMQEVLDNAFKFSDAGTPVIVKTYLEDQHYIMQVVDNGRGMTKDQIQEIRAFMQFERDHYEQQGMGLGLALCKQIAKLYDLKVDIESNPESGLVVTVCFKTK